jgi:hypothetical protein
MLTQEVAITVKMYQFSLIVKSQTSVWCNLEMGKSLHATTSLRYRTVGHLRSMIAMAIWCSTRANIQ